MMFIDVIAIISALIGVIPYLPILYVSRIFLGLQGGLNSSIVVIVFIPGTKLQSSTNSSRFKRNDRRCLLNLIKHRGSPSPNSWIVWYPIYMNSGYANDPEHTFWRVVFLFPISFSVIRIILLKLYVLDEPAQYHI